MHSILFALNKPSDTKDFETWNKIVDELENHLRANKQVEPLGVGAWLFLGSEPLQYIGSAIENMKRLKFQYRLLLIENASDWSPKPSQLEIVEPPKEGHL